MAWPLGGVKGIFRGYSRTSPTRRVGRREPAGMRLPLLLFALALAAALAPARCLARTRYLRCCVEAEASSLEEPGQAEASSSAAALECPIAVRAVHGKGFGAFAVAAVPAGSRVCSYHGEALTQRRVAERYGAGAATQADYLFELRPPSAEAEGLYVDAARSQHPSRFINHDEDGNLVPSPVGRPHERIDFYAARPIQPGEELCFDCARSLLSNQPSLALDAHATRSATATRAPSDFVGCARRWRALLGRAQRWARARVRYAMDGDSTSTPPWPAWSAAGRSGTERPALGTLIYLSRRAALELWCTRRRSDERSDSQERTPVSEE